MYILNEMQGEKGKKPTFKNNKVTRKQTNNDVIEWINANNSKV